MDKKQFKYAEWLTGLPDCPPPNYREVEMTAYRFAHADLQHPNNFKPNRVLQPNRVLLSSAMKCKAWGLSFFDSPGGARASFRKQLSKIPDFAKFVGTHLAAVRLSRDDGVASQPETTNFGHFTFHEYIWADFVTKIDSSEPI